MDLDVYSQVNLWLHITTQGIGFADEIGAADLAAVTAAIRDRLPGLEPPVATFHRATIRWEAVLLKADPPQTPAVHPARRTTGRASQAASLPFRHRRRLVRR